jgi:hypothetical protein
MSFTPFEKSLTKSVIGSRSLLSNLVFNLFVSINQPAVVQTTSTALSHLVAQPQQSSLTTCRTSSLGYRSIPPPCPARLHWVQDSSAHLPQCPVLRQQLPSSPDSHSPDSWVRPKPFLGTRETSARCWSLEYQRKARNDRPTWRGRVLVSLSAWTAAAAGSLGAPWLRNRSRQETETGSGVLQII